MHIVEGLIKAPKINAKDELHLVALYIKSTNILVTTRKLFIFEKVKTG